MPKKKCCLFCVSFRIGEISRGERDGGNPLVLACCACGAWEAHGDGHMNAKVFREMLTFAEGCRFYKEADDA